MNLYTWALKHHVSHEAIADLQQLVGLNGQALPDELEGRSEAALQTMVRLEAAQKGMYLWRNNVGAGKLENGSFLRWGLANESDKINKVIKSADLIGIRRVLVTQGMVGQSIGQFVCREMKRADWQYSGTDAEVAQLAWANLILANGGDAGFATGPGTL